MTSVTIQPLSIVKVIAILLSLNIYAVDKAEDGLPDEYVAKLSSLSIDEKKALEDETLTEDVKQDHPVQISLKEIFKKMETSINAAHLGQGISDTCTAKLHHIKFNGDKIGYYYQAFGVRYDIPVICPMIRYGIGIVSTPFKTLTGKDFTQERRDSFLKYFSDHKIPTKKQLEKDSF